MSNPKMLPFLATTAGIELERAEQLWQSASEYAASLTGENESARYITLAHEHMVALVEHELLGPNPNHDAPWLMIQAHVSVAPMIIADIFAQATALTRQVIGRWTEKKTSTV